MGNCCIQLNLFRNRMSIRNRRRKIVLLLVGLDNSGKTSAAQGLLGENSSGTVPTVGFSTFNLSHKGFSVVIYDLGGGLQIRDIWAQYYVDVHGIVYVIDASDSNRIDESREVLHTLLTHDKLRGKPLLLLANKQDIEGALDEIDVVERLNLEVVVNELKCPTLVETCSAVPMPNNSKFRKANIDPGIQNGFRWLLNIIVKDFHSINSRVETDTKIAKSELMLEKERRRLRVEELRRQREEIEGTIIIPLKDGSPESCKHRIITVHPSSDVTDIENEEVLKSKTIYQSNSEDSGFTVQNGDRDGDSLNTVHSCESAVQPMTTEKNDDGMLPNSTGSQVVKPKLFKKGFMKRSNRTAPSPGEVGTASRGVIPFVRQKLPPLTPPPNRMKMFEANSAKRAKFVKSMSLSFDKTELEQTDDDRSLNLISFPSDWKLLRGPKGGEDAVDGLKRTVSFEGFGKTFIVKNNTAIPENEENS